MEFPVLTRNAKEVIQFNNFMVQRRCVECIFTVAHALICNLRSAKRGDDVKLRGIIVSDCHNKYNDWYSVDIGLSSSGYATEYTTFIVSSDTPEMRTVFRELFGKYSETRETFNEEAEIKGIHLNLEGEGRIFLRNFGRYIQTIQEMLDAESIITPYLHINPFGIPADSFRQMKEEFDELIERYC